MNVRVKPAYVLGALCALFIILRLVVLLSGGMRAFEAEELYRGVIAREILDGLKMPLTDYQADHYSGGSLLAGLAAAPFFLFFGPSIFSLKLAPLAFAFSTLILLWFFMNRNFGTRASFFACLFFIFAPPSFTRLSLVAMGFHSEAVLFNVLTLYFFYRYFYEGRNPTVSTRSPEAETPVFAGRNPTVSTRSPEDETPVFAGRNPRFLFLFGLISGLGFWFTHITIIVPLACLIAWFCLDMKSLFNRRNLMLFLGGGFLGLTPWFVYNFTHDFEGFGFIARNLLHIGGDRPSAFSFDLERLGQLIFKAIPLSFAFETFQTIPRQIICGGYFFGAAALFLPLYAGAFKKDGRLLPLLLIPVIFILSYWLSSMEINAVTEPEFFYLFFDDCRYFVPLHFALFMLLGISMRGNFFAKAAGIFLLALGIFGLSSIAFTEPWGSTLRCKGYAYAQLGSLRGHIWPKLSPDFHAHLKALERYKMPDRFFVFWNSLYGLQFEKNLSDPGKIQMLMNEVPPAYRPHMAQGLGYGLGAQGGLRTTARETALKVIPREYQKYFYLGFVDAAMDNGPELTEDFLDFASTLPAEDREVFYFGLGQIGPYERRKGGLDFILTRPRGETQADLKAFFRGLGVRCMVNWVFEGYAFHKAVENLGFDVPPEYLNDFYWGVGWGLCHQTAEDRVRAAAMMKEIPEAGKNQVLAGFQDCVKSYSIPE